MKAITAVCATGASVPAVLNGRVSRHRDGENAEIKMYLSKLKDLVPFMPKNRKLSKLEIIQHVIDYICDLQSELETHPAVNNFNATAVLNEQKNSVLQNNNNNNNNNSSSSNNKYIEQMSPIHHQQADQQGNYNSACSSQRQPLSVRSSPNTILSTTHSSPHNSTAVNGQRYQTQANSSHLYTREKNNS